MSRSPVVLLLFGVMFTALPLHATEVSHSSKKPIAARAQTGVTKKVDSEDMEAEDAKVIAEALTLEMGDACVPAENESPRVKVTLGNVKRISDSMIAEFTKMVQEEIEEKRGPIKIGPPEIMNQVLSSRANMRAFSNYHLLRTTSPRGSSLADRAKQREAFEAKVVGAYAGKEEVSLETLARAGELAEGLDEIVRKPQFFPTRSNAGPITRNYLGVEYQKSEKKFFTSLEDVAPALPKMNAYLSNAAADLKRDTALVNALADGMVLSVPTALMTVGRTTVAAHLAKKGISLVAGAPAPAAPSAGASVSVPAQVLLLSTIVNTVGNDLRTVATNYTTAETKNWGKSFIGLTNPAPAKTEAEFAKDPEAQGELAKKKIEETLLSSLPLSDGGSAKHVEVPAMADPTKFTQAIGSIREATKAYLNKPDLLRHVNAGENVTASSALNASLQTLEDTKSSNDALNLNMQSFYNTSQRASADYIALARHFNDSKKKSVSRDDIDKLAVSLDADINLMLEKMDDSASVLANQSEYFSKGIDAIESACAEDQKKIFNSWGKYRQFFRDKLGVSPWGGPESPAKAYLADAILARADCVTKKSIARRMEMMRLGAVLTQFKSSCQDIKKWSSAGTAYKNVREQLLKRSKASQAPTGFMMPMPAGAQ